MSIISIVPKLAAHHESLLSVTHMLHYICTLELWVYAIRYIYVTGSERTHLPRTQQEDTLFTITR